MIPGCGGIEDRRAGRAHDSTDRREAFGPSVELSGMKILLGLGGRADGFDALEATLEQARQAGDDLTVAVLDTASDEDPENVARTVRERVADNRVDADVRTLSGHPGSVLTELAEQEGFDRIVLGGGERTPLGKITLGEVAEFVLLNADVSVTLVR
jgi:nucleotide-binding universal stress UspA family protein